MSNEEDECDSSGLFTVASQSDVIAFLHAQEAKITGLNSTISDNDDDDESFADVNLLTRFSRNNSTLTKPYLSHSCFASISSASSSSSSQKSNTLDDLTELKWLNTFKLKDFKQNPTNNQETKQKTSQLITNIEDHISKLSNELKTYDNKHINIDSISYGVLIFLALYSKRDDEQTPWSLTIKEIYEYIQIHIKQILTKRGWKNLLKQTLCTIPCFIKTKHDLIKSQSIWTIDPYYRPLLKKAYLTNLSLQLNKNMNRSSKSIENHFPPKATVKTKALPRLYERLCEEKSGRKDEDDTNSIDIVKQQHKLILGGKRPRSTSSSGYSPPTKNNDKNRLSLSSSWSTKIRKYHKIQDCCQSAIELKSLTSNKESTIITPCPSVDHMYLEKQNQSTIEYNELPTDEDDECDSSSYTYSSHKSIITTRTQIATSHPIKNGLIHRRKFSPPKKHLSRRANTRISRKIIEQDLQLLRQANNDQSLRDLSIISNNQYLSIQKSTNNNSIITDRQSSIEDIVFDLSFIR